MTKIQYRGHCPHCARQQAVRNGGMAKHGYTVDYGYFNGTCSGADMPPMERAPGQAEAAAHVAHLRARADEISAATFTAPDRVRSGGKWVDWAGALPHVQQRAEDNWVREQGYHARAFRDMADYVSDWAGKVKDQPLLEVKIGDKPKALQVGDRFKLHGGTHTVKALKYATARGVGPGINGDYVEHVVYERDGIDRQYPKRYCRKIHD